jgi:hypothetical protein
MVTRIPAPESVTSGSGPGRKVAVLICHGMGEQVPFETLGLVVAALQKATDKPVAALRGARAVSRGVRTAFHGGERIPLVHVDLDRPGTETRHLTMFECYWAPVTAGKVHLFNAIIFYLRAGYRGLRYSMGRAFDRRIGDRTWSFTLGAVIPLTLLFSLDILLAVTGWLLSLELLCLFVLWRLAALPGHEQLPIALVSFAVVVFATVAVAGGLVAWLLSFAVSFQAHRRQHPVPVNRGNRRLALITRLWRRVISWLLVGLPLVEAVYLCEWILRNRGAWGWLRSAPVSHRVTALLLMALLVWLLVKGRAFLIEYTGDVAAYMSAHEVSRFADIRNEIQARCWKMMEYVYGLSTDDGVEFTPYFDEVIVVGHSLGSVVAYDVMNELVGRDRATGRNADCAGRTSLFLTFGSPLDKIAFIFRSQRPDEETDIREELAAERQPMILEEQYRPRRWVNLSNPFDWIGSSIDYFDLQPAKLHSPRRSIANLVEGDRFNNPGHAHSGYWRRRAFQQLLLWGAAGCPGDGIPRDKAWK